MYNFKHQTHKANEAVILLTLHVAYRVDHRGDIFGSTEDAKSGFSHAVGLDNDGHSRYTTEITIINVYVKLQLAAFTFHSTIDVVTYNAAC